MKKIKPLKKKHKGLKIFLIVLCVILVLPIAFIFIAFYDPKSKDVSDTDVHYENLVSQVFYKGLQNLDPTTTNPELKFTIDEEMIDGIMMAACDKINQKQWIPKMYCFINDNNYTFAMDAQASFFKTRAFIDTTLDKDDESILTFQINKITIGRLPIPVNWVTGLLGNFINDEMLNNAFNKSGFRIESHLSERKLTYSRKNFREDVGGYLSKLGSENPFLNVLLSVFDNDEVLTANYKDGVSVGLNLGKLTLAEGKYKKEAPIQYTDLDNLKSEIVKLLNENVLEENKVAETFKYLIRGYDESAADYVLSIKDTSLATNLKSYLGITNLTDYTTGTAIKYYDESHTQLLTGHFANFKADKIDDVVVQEENKVTFSLPSYDLNKVLVNSLKSVIGCTIPVTFKDGDNWGFEYIFVDNVYVGFEAPEEITDPKKDNKFIIYIELNVAGLPITLSIVTNEIGLEGNSGDSLGYIKFSPQEAFFGKIPLTNELFDSVLSLIPDGDASFVYDTANKIFKVKIDPLTSLSETDKSAINEIIGRVSAPTPKIENDAFTLTYQAQ